MPSQSDEDRYIAQACTKNNGRFLDIGAWQPVVFSNTRALFERGWSGVMIEPSPTPMEALLREYGNEPRITLVQACVGLTTSMAKLHVTQDALSTTDLAHKAAWQEKGGYYGSMMVPQVTLAELFAVFPADFDFVSIDTEGNSVELLKEMFRLGVHPWCVCFEHDRRFAESFALLHDEGYKLIYENDTNRIIQLRG
jgi:FkbM family methyltransferase